MPNFQPRPQNQQNKVAVFNDQNLPQHQVTPDGLTRFLPPSTNLPLINRCKVRYFQINFRDLNTGGLIDTGDLSSAIPGDHLCKLRLLAPHTKTNESFPSEFQIMVSNGQLEAPVATIGVQFEVSQVL